MNNENVESLIKIPSQKLTKDVNHKGLQNYPKPIKTKDESSSQRVTTNQFRANEKPLSDQTNLRENASTEGQRHQVHGISSDTTQNDEPTNCDNANDIDDDDRYLGASLREESLDDLFSNDKAENPNETYLIIEAENTNEDQNVSEVATDVKKELVSDTEEEGAEEIEEQMDEQQQNMQNSIILVKQEVENDELSNNGNMQSAQINNSIIIYDPTENQESSSASSSTDPFPDLHQDIPLAPINLRLVQLSSMGTSSSSSAHSENQPLKWDLRNKSTVSAKAEAASKVTREVVIDSSCSNTDMSRTDVYNFVIDEGKVIKRDNYVEECKVHVSGSTSFLKRPLGHLLRLTPPRHCKLTLKLQNDIKTLISYVMLRAKQVKQNGRGDNKFWITYIAPADRLYRISRLFVTDSMLAGLNDEVFRNMFVFRLDFHKNMDIFITQLDALRDVILNCLFVFEFDYIFILYGYDLINQDEKPSLDSTRKLKSWFEENLIGCNFQKPKDDCVYQYSIPQFVVITLPEIGNKAEQIKEYNNDLRILVQNRHGEPNGYIYLNIKYKIFQLYFSVI
uniref:Helitron_like_N domain-containing protein n=1 Tax=Meloidogyne hapla TaxID=6305 RepID=A0A1I8B7L1_MELHA